MIAVPGQWPGTVMPAMDKDWLCFQERLQEIAELGADADGKAGEEGGQQPAARACAGQPADFAPKFAADIGGVFALLKRGNIDGPPSPPSGAK